MIAVANLAQLKRFLAQPGARLLITRHDLADRWSPEFRARFARPAAVTGLQTNAAVLDNGTRLRLTGATRFQFAGDRIAFAAQAPGCAATWIEFQLMLARPALIEPRRRRSTPARKAPKNGHLGRIMGANI
jgi:hypothetical protein